MGAERLSNMRILLLEENPRDAERVTAALAAGGLAPEVVRVETRDDFLAALRQQVQELAAANRRKDRFLAILGHELRNPLAAISNALHLIGRRSSADPSLERSCELIGRQVRHLVRLTDDLLDLSRVGEGRLEVRMVHLDLVALIRTVAEDSRAALDEAQLALRLELPEAPVWVQGDPTRLTQALANLLNNAVKFTDPGGEVTITVGVGSSGGPPDPTPNPQPPTPTAVLRVRDTGIGIAPEILPQLFDPFVQAEASQFRSRSGLGLGLALVKGLVELHGGRVQAASDGPGRGAEFTVWLPLAEDRPT